MSYYGRRQQKTKRLLKQAGIVKDAFERLGVF